MIRLLTIALTAIAVIFMVQVALRLGGGQRLDPTVAGYLALFGAGFVVAELIRPVLSLFYGPIRFLGIVGVAILAWLGVDTVARQEDGILARRGVDIRLPVRATRAELGRGPDGTFRGVADIGSGRFAVVASTGERLTLISPADARAAGLGPQDFGAEVTLVRDMGPIRIAPVTLPFVAVGDVRVPRVAAGVVLDANPASVILGQSFLLRLSDVRITATGLRLTR